jgi:hypothetical protein
VETATLLRGHVERVLQEHWHQHHLVVDGDGDYPFRAGQAMCWVSVQSDPAAVQVFAQAVRGVKRSAKLLAEVNELSGSARWVKVFWHDDTVFVSRILDVDGADAGSIRRACDTVATVAQDIAPMLAAVFGGEPPLPPEVEHAGGERGFG